MARTGGLESREGGGGYLAAVGVAVVAAFVVAWQYAALQSAEARIAALEARPGGPAESTSAANGATTTPIPVATAGETSGTAAGAGTAQRSGPPAGAPVTVASDPAATLPALEPVPVVVSPVANLVGALGGAPREARAAIARRLLDDPEYRRLLAALQREQVREEYAAAARRLGLDAAEAERFYELLAEQGLRASERALATRAGLGDPAVGEDLQARADRELGELLGADRLLELQRYQAGLRGQGQARAIQSAFAARGVPLTPAQLDSLAPRLAAAQAESRSAAREQGEFAAAQGLGPTQLGGEAAALARYDEDTRRYVAAVRPVVSGPQLAAYEAIRAQQRLRIEASVRAQAIARETAGAPPGRR